ncbi:hypothetical protein Micbo1qcDRAFT_157352, partial [Microdochium bolleyi]
LIQIASYNIRPSPPPAPIFTATCCASTAGFDGCGNIPLTVPQHTLDRGTIPKHHASQHSPSNLEAKRRSSDKFCDRRATGLALTNLAPPLRPPKPKQCKHCTPHAAKPLSSLPDLHDPPDPHPPLSRIPYLGSSSTVPRPDSCTRLAPRLTARRFSSYYRRPREIAEPRLATAAHLVPPQH